MSSHLVVEGATTHNLREVDCRIPHGAMTVVTGPSGSGKSSLVFDTLFTEGQRRFIECLSTYARQFLDRLEAPPVRRIDGVIPAVALEARNSIRGARAAVGTLTDLLPTLRLLFSAVGQPHCPDGHGPLVRRTVQEAVDRLLEGGAGDRFELEARLERPPKGASHKLRELVRQGFSRRRSVAGVERLDGRLVWKPEWDPLVLVLGRFRADGSAARLAETVEEGWSIGRGRVWAVGTDALALVRGWSCERCGFASEPPTPALLSFDSPLGACDRCQGFGRVIGLDRRKVIPDERLSLAEHPVQPWNSPAYRRHYRKLFAACEAWGIPLDVPWGSLGAAQQEAIWAGGPGWKGVEGFFARLERKSYRMHVRIFLARYRSYDPCPDCGGSRLGPAGREVRVAGATLPELGALEIEELAAWCRERQDEHEARAERLLVALHERLQTLLDVGVGYLTLERSGRSLSGGEVQRLHLATALGSGLTDTLYALDEPTVGLHARDTERLIDLLHRLTDRGNTVLLVEHDAEVIRRADRVIDLGPGAGSRGGRKLFEGPVAELLTAETPTGIALREAERLGLGREWEPAQRWVRIRGARQHNLQGVDVEIPLGRITAVTGVSGSGKSSLVRDVLFEGWRAEQRDPEAEPGDFSALEGLEELTSVEFLDHRPLGRTRRSNPVTYVQAWGEIRKLLADAPLARKRRLTPGHFSFNSDKGRCLRCQGRGTEEVDLQFLAPVEVPCEECGGRRFRREILEVRLDGRNAAEILELTVEDAYALWNGRRALERRLGLLIDVGLGYLPLGQSTDSLSLGEAQRLKLAGFLLGQKKAQRSLLLFDEPTTGLHLSDVDRLYEVLRRLADEGHGVVVVEHHLELVARCDWVVDLGPGGGRHGGRLLFQGPVAELVAGGMGPTAEALRKRLGR